MQGQRFELRYATTSLAAEGAGICGHTLGLSRAWLQRLVT